MAIKKSPRAPSMPLDEALDKAVRVYERERRHAAPTEIVAQDIGYKNANNGAALSALASLRYYGLLERPKDGHLAVSSDVETYIYAPDEDRKRSLRLKWLRAPAIFQDLTEKYADGLPSDANLRFELISQGFIPRAAESLVQVFKRSVDFAGLYEPPPPAAAPGPAAPEESNSAPTDAPVLRTQQGELPAPVVHVADDGGTDRIPVRLHGGRRAWLIIPSPFYEADKKRLHAHIDLLLTDDATERTDSED